MRGGLGFLNFPKCVFFFLKNNFFLAKIDKESPKCTEGGFTGLGKIPKIEQYFVTPSLMQRWNLSMPSVPAAV